MRQETLVSLASDSDLRELPRVPLRGQGYCGVGGASRDSTGFGETVEGLISSGGRNLRLLSISDSDRRVPAGLGQESQASSCLRKGTPLARVARGVSGPSSSCVWNPQVFADDARGWQCPFVLCLQILDARSEIKPMSPNQEMDSQQLDHQGSPLRCC